MFYSLLSQFALNVRAAIFCILLVISCDNSSKETKNRVNSINQLPSDSENFNTLNNDPHRPEENASTESIEKPEQSILTENELREISPSVNDDKPLPIKQELTLTNSFVGNDIVDSDDTLDKSKPQEQYENKKPPPSKLPKIERKSYEFEKLSDLVPVIASEEEDKILRAKILNGSAEGSISSMGDY